MIKGFFELLLTLFSKFAVLLPGDQSFDLDGSVNAIMSVWAYVCYFIPMHDMAVVFSAWAFMVGVVWFVFGMIKIISHAIKGV